MRMLYLGLGTNLGNKEANIKNALEELSGIFGPIVKCSEFYNSKPWGFDSENDFLNAVVIFKVGFTAVEILDKTQQIEKNLGRKNKTDTVYTDRLIDIDILLLDNLIVDQPKLKIPHPLLTERDFVIIPLAEIAPDELHPIFMKTFSELKKMNFGFQ